MDGTGEHLSNIAKLQMAQVERVPAIAVVGQDLLIQFEFVNTSRYSISALRIKVLAERFSDYHIRECSDNFTMDGDQPVTRWWIFTERKCNLLLYNDENGRISPGQKITGTIKVRLSGLTDGPVQRIRGISVDWIPVRIVVSSSYQIDGFEAIGNTELVWGEITFAHTGNPPQRFATRLRDEWYEWLAIMMVGMVLGRLSTETFSQVLDTIRDAVNRILQLLLTG